MPILQNLRERLWTNLAPPGLQEAARRVLESNDGNLSEPGWLRMSMGGVSSLLELDSAARQDAYEASYYYWQRDPLVGRGVQLYRDYVFGRGLSYQAKEKRVQTVLDRFWKDPLNRASVSRAAAQWQLQERAMLAGEVFLCLFVNRLDGRVTVRIVEPTEIDDVITAPEDRQRPMFYRRTWRQDEWSFTGHSWGIGATRVDYIPDWSNLEADGEGKPVMPKDATVGTDTHLVVMHHLKFNSHGKRGVSPLFRILPWTKAHKGFMEDRATLTLALATFAFKQKIKGNAAAVARLAAQWGNYDAASRYGAGGKERREGSQTVIENDAVTLEQFRTDSGSSSAYMDARMLRQQVAAGLGLTEPDLTGDPSVSNLASIREMAGPMFRAFESWQQTWKDEFTDLFAFVIRMAQAFSDLPAMGVDTGVEVDFPQLVTRDLPAIVGAIASIIQAQAVSSDRYIAPKRLARYLLQAFGEDDIDAAMEELDELVRAPMAAGTPTTAGTTVETILAQIHEATREYRNADAD